MTDETGDQEPRTYRHVRADEAPDAPSPTTHKYEVDEAVGTTEFGLNVYVAEPGQRVPWGRHYHPDHEEAFYVTQGCLEVTLGPVETPDVVRVEAGEVLFVPPNTPQRAEAVGDERLEMVAVGAPKANDTAVVEERCPACGELTGREFDVEDGGATYVLSCADCAAELDRLRSGPD
jgi:quercetin dioxygenase-like cupin family protein